MPLRSAGGRGLIRLSCGCYAVDHITYSFSSKWPHILHLAVLHLVVLKSQAQLVCKAFKLVLALNLLMSHGRGKLHAISDSKDRK